VAGHFVCLLQCQPEYKLPGLYVIDAIVRESRRQFSPEKDLYAPRFAKNFEATFHNLLTYCPPSDRVRMLCFVLLYHIYEYMVVVVSALTLLVGIAGSKKTPGL